MFYLSVGLTRQYLQTKLSSARILKEDRNDRNSLLLLLLVIVLLLFLISII